MAVTFLVVSRRGHEQVTTLTQQATAKNARTPPCKQADAQIISLALAQRTGFNFSLVRLDQFNQPRLRRAGVRTPSPT